MNLNLKMIASTCQYWADRCGRPHIAILAADGSIHYQIAGYPIAGKFLCKAA